MIGADFNAAEKYEAKRDRARLVKNSGRGERKGDAIREPLLIDYKFTEKKSFALNNAAFAKHDSDAFKAGFEPVIVVVFPDGKRLAVMNWNYVMDLHDKLAVLEQETGWAYE